MLLYFILVCWCIQADKNADILGIFYYFSTKNISFYIDSLRGTQEMKNQKASQMLSVYPFTSRIISSTRYSVLSCSKSSYE